MLHRLYHTGQDSYHQEHDIHAGRHFFLFCACHQASRPEWLFIGYGSGRCRHERSGRYSVCFENIYGENQNERTQRVTAKADPFTMEGLRDINARIIHLGSLLADDFSLDVIKYLSGKGLLSVDVQGFLRKVDNEKVLPVDWPEKKEALKHIHILKANETEMEVLTGCKEPHEAALLIADWGVKEVLLTLGDKGSLIYAKGQFHEIPAYSALQIVDATGCGDTYMVGYLYMRNKGASYQEAGCFAAAMCTIKLQTHGPFRGTEAEIRRIINLA